MGEKDNEWGIDCLELNGLVMVRWSIDIDWPRSAIYTSPRTCRTDEGSCSRLLLFFTHHLSHTFRLHLSKHFGISNQPETPAPIISFTTNVVCRLLEAALSSPHRISCHTLSLFQLTPIQAPRKSRRQRTRPRRTTAKARRTTARARRTTAKARRRGVVINF